jgi:hypothetical protein
MVEHHSYALDVATFLRWCVRVVLDSILSLTLEPTRQRKMANFVPLLSNSVPQAFFCGGTEKSNP